MWRGTHAAILGRWGEGQMHPPQTSVVIWQAEGRHACMRRPRCLIWPAGRRIPHACTGRGCLLPKCLLPRGPCQIRQACESGWCLDPSRIVVPGCLLPNKASMLDGAEIPPAHAVLTTLSVLCPCGAAPTRRHGCTCMLCAHEAWGAHVCMLCAHGHGSCGAERPPIGMCIYTCPCTCVP